jgi:hypothetical protein
MKIEGNKVITAKSQKEMFEFLSDLKNFESIMPENIQKFEVDGDSFLFGLPGMPELRLVLKEKTEFSSIVLGAASSKMPFTLTADIQKVSEVQSEVQLLFEGKFNAMMSVMIKKPLTKFVSTLTENLAKF